MLRPTGSLGQTNQVHIHVWAALFIGGENDVKKLANSGQQGIDLAIAKQPSIILMDLAMPDMDGLEATQILKQDLRTRNITVIACSAFVTGGFMKKAWQTGCEGYITKPIEPNDLVNQVRQNVLAAKIRRKLLCGSLK